MTAGLLNDLNNMGHSIFGDVTSFVGGFVAYIGHRTSTASHDTQPSTIASPITYTSVPHTHEVTSTAFNSINSILLTPSAVSSYSSISFTTSNPSRSSFISSSFSPIPTTPLTSEVSTSTVPTSTVSQITSYTSARAPSKDKVMLIMVFQVISFAIFFMVFLLINAPLIVRFFKFLPNFLTLFFDRTGGTFGRDYEAGLNSEAFTLQENIDREDRRNGLDKKAKLRILWYMYWYEETFDDARLRYVRHLFSLNGIGEDGQPLDPKYIRTY